VTYGEPGPGYLTWTLAEEESRPLIRQAVGAGINFFDTANRVSLMRKSAQVSAHDETSGPWVDRRFRVPVAGYIPFGPAWSRSEVTAVMTSVSPGSRPASNRRQVSITSLARSRLMRR
jgi:hypothetical protein